MFNIAVDPEDEHKVIITTNGVELSFTPNEDGTVDIIAPSGYIWTITYPSIIGDGIVDIELSGGAAPMLDLKTRNISVWTDQYEVGEARDFISSAVGEVVQLADSQPFYWLYYVYSIGVNDYIYFTTQDDDNVYINEYQISTQITKSIILWSYGDGGSFLDWALFSYIEPHKILASPCNYLDMDPYSQVFILDFEAMTRTSSLATNDIDEIEAMYVDEVNGHTMLCVIGWLDIGYGWGAYVKDYTADGDWEFSSVEFTHDEWINSEQKQGDWSVVNHRYICGYTGYDAHFSDGIPPAQLQVVCLDIYTNTWQKSEKVSVYQFTDSHAYQVYFNNFSGQQDITNEKLYIQASGYGWGDYNDPPPGITYGDLFVNWFEYEPSTNTLLSIYQDHWDAFDTATMGTWATTVFSTDEHAYFGYYYDEKLYLANDLSEAGVVDVSKRYGLSLMDNDKVLYRYAAGSGGTVVQMIDSSGNILKSWDLSTYGAYAYLRCAGHGILVEMDDAGFDNCVVLLLI
jgi:hypothetical protein